MKKSKIGIILLAVTFILATVLSGCGKTKETSPSTAPAISDTAASAAPSKTTKPKEPVTIAYEAWTPYKEDMDKIVEEFKKVHPEITVNVTLHANFSEYMIAVKTAIATGSAPDVMGFDSPTSLGALKNEILPLDDLATKDLGADWKKKFLSSPMADVTSDGKTMGLPMGISPGGLIWYNKTMLDKLGIKEPKTYAELKTATDALRKDGKQPLLLGAKDSWIVIDTFQTILNDIAPGKQYDAYAKKTPFTDPDIIKAFDTWKKMFDDKIFQDAAFSMMEYMDVYNAFIDKQSGGFESNGAWNLDIYGNKDLKAKVDAVEWGVMPFPDFNGDGKIPPTLSTVGGFAISKSSKHQDAAWELLKFMGMGKGMQIMTNHFLWTPPLTDKVELTAQLSPNATKVRDTINQIVAQTPPAHRGIDNPKVSDKLYEVLTNVAYGKINGAEAAKEVQAVIDAGK